MTVEALASQLEINLYPANVENKVSS